MGKTRRILIVVLVVVLAVSLTALGRSWLDSRQAERDRAAAAAMARMNPGFPTTSSGEQLPQEAVSLGYIDLNALRTENPDVVGWVEIPGTELAYPLVQGEDNQYYLKHSWRDEANSGGAIFLESTSSPDLSDFHTIIYGHRMFNDSMFGTLKYYRDAEYWRAHPSVYVVVDAGVYRYDVFAAYEAGIEDTVYELDFTNREQKLIDYANETTVLETDVTPAPGQQHLALSTCTGRGHAKRWVVHTVLAEIYRERGLSHETEHPAAGPVLGAGASDGLR